MPTEIPRRKFTAEDVNRLRGKIWIHDLKIHSGIDSVQQIRKKYDPRSSHSTWDNYEKGIHSPTVRKGIDRVKQLASKFPDSDEVFNCMSWKVLKAEKHSETQLKEAISKLGAPISELILYGSVIDPFKIGGHPIDFAEFCDELKMFPDFTTLRSLVLLLGLAKIYESDEMWNGICFVYQTMILEFLIHKTIPFYPEVFAIIDNFALQRERMAVNRKPVPIFTPWNKQLPNYKQNLIEHYTAGLKFSYFSHELTKTDSSDEILTTMSELLVEIVWQCGWAKNHNVSELWGPLMESFIKLTQEYEDYTQLTNADVLFFFEGEFANIFRDTKKEVANPSNYTSSFPSIFEPKRISKFARSIGYPPRMKIYAPHINPRSTDT